MNRFKQLLACVSAGILLCSCAPDLPNNTVDIDLFEAREQIETLDNIVLVDVRTPEEWSEGVIDNAIKINFKDSDFEEKIAKLDKNAHTIVYCKSGGRSAKATALMSQLGFKNLYNLSDGYDGYSKK
ncbi:MAG: rhodanese-like domain-containing protein [Flavobacteriales bacterium]